MCYDGLVDPSFPEELEAAKRAVRDAQYMSRYCGPEKAKLMGAPTQEAAMATGVGLLIAPAGPSPYKL